MLQAMCSNSQYGSLAQFFVSALNRGEREKESAFAASQGVEGRSIEWTMERSLFYNYLIMVTGVGGGERLVG